MNSLIGPVLQCLVLIISRLAITSDSLHIPRLSPIRSGMFRSLQSEALSAFDPSEYETFYYNQTLDHFNFRPDSFSTFQQKYVINSKYWDGSNISAPIFAYLGAEVSLDSVISYTGFLPENANQFQALLIYIQHRYYGESIPFGSRTEAFQNASTLGYFNSAQALADYAEILVHVKTQLNAEHSPVIVIGGSYGGMLASWFRLKYPHIALGALASSAPILYFDDIIPPENGYLSIVTKDFREAGETCYQTIKQSWSEIDTIASMPDGLSNLSKIFHTCSPLRTAHHLKYSLQLMYTRAAQFDDPSTNPVNVICSGIDGAASLTNDTLAKIFAGLVAIEGNRSCYLSIAPSSSSTNALPSNANDETSEGWSWQACSEMVMPVFAVGNNTMFQPYSFDVQSYINNCKAQYGVSSRPNWITTYYGGHVWSHCLDLVPSNPSTDPDWLINQRKIEVEIIKGWMTTLNSWGSLWIYSSTTAAGWPAYEAMMVACFFLSTLAMHACCLQSSSLKL
ncbi:hypothetical protein ACLB2K_022187 [Fragaria x ananassa]